MTLLESRTEGLWAAKQAAKGTAATTADKQFRKVGGDINVNREDGSENYSDGQRFGDAVDFVNTLSGEGSPVVQGQAGPAAFLLAMILGSESVSQIGTSGIYEHVATPGSSGYWMTLWKKVGVTVGPLRQKHVDARMVSLRIEGSSANKVVKLTPTFVILQTGEIFTTDPVKVLDDDDPFFFTEGEGRFKIDTEVYRGNSSFAIVIGDGATPWYGDSVKPHDVGFGIANVTLEGVTIALDSQGLQRYYQQIYGATAPAVGAKPLTTVPGLGAYEVDLRKGSHQVLAVTGTPTGGSIALTVPTKGTVTVPFDSTAAGLQTLLEGIVGRGKVTVSGGPLPGTALTVVFTDTQSTMTKVDSLTGGTAPASSVTDNGHHRGLKLELPGVQWSPDLAVAGNPDGGPTEVALGGGVRAVSGQPFIRGTTRNGDSAAY